MQRDANRLVPDTQQPPADQDNDRGDPSLVQACPGIQVQTDLIAVHTKNVLVHMSTYKVHTRTYLVRTISYRVRTQ
jgi:hypothetical protein